MTTTLDFVLLYVDDVARSAAFYRALLDRAPAEQSPTFAMFTAPGGPHLGLWSRRGVQPAPAAPPGAAEIAWVVDDVDAACAAWGTKGVRVIQPPCDMDFGRTAVALDPDGHRLRVFTPAPPPPPQPSTVTCVPMGVRP